MTTTHFVWDRLSDNVLAEYDDAGDPIAQYTNEPGQFGELVSQHRGGDTSTYHYDGLGNTRQLTDENQNVTDEYTFSAFGEEVAKIGTTVNPFGFQGALGYQANPSSDELYVRARYFRPSLGRWLSEDPIGFIDGPNLFAYVYGNPTNNSDPSGHATFCQQKLFEFGKWYSGERLSGLGWMKGLPDCPCFVEIYPVLITHRFCKLIYGYTREDRARVFELDDNGTWESLLPVKKGDWYHPGASWCMRSGAIKNGAAQQCCYDEDGQLITEPPAAGTPDRISSGENLPGHVFRDVIAYNLAVFLDKYCTQFPQYVDMYMEVRPPNQGRNAKGKPCEKNPPPKKPARSASLRLRRTKAIT